MQRRVVLRLQGLLDVKGAQRLRQRSRMAELGCWQGWCVLLRSAINEEWLQSNGQADHCTNSGTNCRTDCQADGQADCCTDN